MQMAMTKQIKRRLNKLSLLFYKNASVRKTEETIQAEQTALKIVN